MRVVAGNFENLTFGETTASRGYPSGAAAYVSNMVFESDGTVRKRSGMQAIAAWNMLPGMSPIGIAHQLGGTLMVAGSLGQNIDGLMMTTDEVASGKASDIHLALSSQHTVAHLAGAYGLGPSAAIGDHHILPVTNKDGEPLIAPNIYDSIDNHSCYGIASFQVTNVQQSTVYRIGVTATDQGGVSRTATYWVKSPQLEPPFVLDISDIPAILGNGQANPNYSRDVAARQASHAQSRANWIRTTSSQLTPMGLGPIFWSAARQRKQVDTTKNDIDYGVYGDDVLINGTTVLTEGASVYIEVPRGYKITAIDFPTEWKGASGSVNTQDTLPAIGLHGQIVAIGKSDLILQADSARKQWREIPRMSISGSLPLVAISTTSRNGVVGASSRFVTYGDMAPSPTSAPKDMAEMLRTAGAPIRTMYVSGRFCVICEHAIMVSSASRPLDFFPKSSSTVTPGDGGIIEISSSSAEFIIDALPVRSGAFVLTNFGAYVVQVADITQASIQKVRDTAFPATATHSICNVNGEIWHYWHTAIEHSVRVYTESAYGTSWQSSNPIPHYDLTHTKIPRRSQIVGTSTGDTVFLILDNVIKVFSRRSDFFSVTTISHTVGEFVSAVPSGDSLLMFVRLNSKLVLLRYDRTAPPGTLDGWTQFSSVAPVRTHASRGWAVMEYEHRDHIPGDAPMLIGSAFFPFMRLLPPPQERVSTPGAWATMRDVTFTVRDTISACVHDGHIHRDYSNCTRAVDMMIPPKPGVFSFTHPIYRMHEKPITIRTPMEGSFYAWGNLEIVRASYTMTVIGDRSPSAWGGQ